MNQRPDEPNVQSDVETSVRKVLAQRRFFSATRYTLGKEDFEYQLRTEGSVRTYRMEYSELSAERESLLDRNPWWRNVGVVLIAFGGLLAFTGASESVAPPPQIWLCLGALCMAVYRFSAIRFQIIPAERCSVLVIDDASGAEVLRELESRRATQLRARYDFISRSEHPDQQRSRFHWLSKQGVLDANELSARMLQLDAISSAYAQAREDRDDD